MWRGRSLACLTRVSSPGKQRKLGLRLSGTEMSEKKLEMRLGALGTIRNIDTDLGVFYQNAEVERAERRAGKGRKEDLGEPLAKPAFGGLELPAAGAEGGTVAPRGAGGLWRLDVPAVPGLQGHPGR